MTTGNQNTVSFTEESFTEFKAKYESLKHDQDVVFEFEGNFFVVGYAKYMIEYLEGRNDGKI